MMNRDVLSVIADFATTRPEHVQEWCDTTLKTKWIGEFGANDIDDQTRQADHGSEVFETVCF